jgi:putative hydrolase of the HAD superfamily
LRAVIFDLWDTLIEWDAAAASRMVESVSALAGDGFRERWLAARHRYTTPIRGVLSELGVPSDALDEVCRIRSEYVRRAVVPRPGAVETLRTLRERGYLLGLITVCTEDVETVWADTEFAGLFDAEVFSSRIGISKPDPRIYLACCEQLGVEPSAAVFVGDGANDELDGARRVGMQAVLIHRPGEDPLWPELRAWDGPRITCIPEVLEVLGAGAHAP